MESFHVRINSNSQPFELQVESKWISIGGVALPYSEISSYSKHSENFSSAFVDAQVKWFSVETNSKILKVEQGTVSFFGFGKRQDDGGSLYNAVHEVVAEIVQPCLILNILLNLSRGETVKVGPLYLTNEGVMMKTLLTEKFCSWDWNVRHEVQTRGLGMLSSASGYRLAYEITFRCPQTGVKKTLGELKSDERNCGSVAWLCVVLGCQNEDSLFPSLDKLLNIIRENLQLFVPMPQCALRRRLELRFPELLLI